MCAFCYGSDCSVTCAAFTPNTCSPDTSCIHLYPLVSGYKLLVRDTCIRLHVSGVNAVLGDVLSHGRLESDSHKRLLVT